MSIIHRKVVRCKCGCITFLAMLARCLEGLLAFAKPLIGAIQAEAEFRKISINRSAYLSKAVSKAEGRC